MLTDKSLLALARQLLLRRLSIFKLDLGARLLSTNEIIEHFKVNLDELRRFKRVGYDAFYGLVTLTRQMV